MARTRWRPDSSLISDVMRRPEAYEFFQAVRLVERSYAMSARRLGAPPPEPVGRGSDPKSAPLFMRSSTSLAYAAAEVTELVQREGRWNMIQTVIGLNGSTGVMPHALSELVYSSVRERNSGLREFLDLFNNRLAGLLYEAWAKQRIAVESERRNLPGARTPIESMLRAVIGIGLPSLSERMSLPDAIVIHYAGLLSRNARSATTIEQVLSGALGQPVQVEQFLGEWLPIAVADQTKLPSSDVPEGIFSRLGEDTVLGARAWNVEGTVRLHIGPMTYSVFESLLPEGHGSSRLADLATFALGPDLAFISRLILRAEEVPSLRLQADAGEPAANRLGWNTWLGWNGARESNGEVDFRSVLPKQ